MELQNLPQLPELIAEARKMSYLIAEGFCDDSKFEMDEMGDQTLDAFDTAAEQLAKLAGVSVEAAGSAIMTVMIKTLFTVPDKE